MKKLLLLAGMSAFCLVAAAMPTKAELKKVQKLVNELMAGDIQAMKAGKMDAPKVAANAEQYARDAETEAAKFLLLKGSFGLYMQGGSYDEALRVLDVMTREIKDVPDKVLSEIVLSKLKRLSKNEGAAVFEYYERLEQRMRFAEDRKRIEAALKANPSSKDVNREMAVCLVGLGDWSGALRHFALTDGKEAEAAKAESKGQTVEAANLWWDAAAADSGDDYREHAAALYQKAIADGKLTGLKLALAKKRIAAVAPAETVAAASKEPETPPQRGDDAPAAAKQTDEQVVHSPTPTRISNSSSLKPIVIPLKGKGVRPLEFVPIPAGTAEVGHGSDGLRAQATVKITRPFLMTKLLIDYSQFHAVMGETPQKMNVILGRKELYSAFKALGGETKVAAALLDIEADALVQALNKKFRRSLPKGYVFRLPTFAEYEYVEKGGRSWTEPEVYRALNDGPREKTPTGEFAWLAEEGWSFSEYLDLLRKSGVKVPEFSAAEIAQSNAHRGPCMTWRELFSRRGALPTGLKKPNPFGICDLKFGSIVADRFGDEHVGDADLNLKHDGERARFFDVEFDRSVAGDTDPLFWPKKDQRFFIVRRSFAMNMVMPAGVGYGPGMPAHVVIGPDLVAERKARGGK